MDIPVHPTLYKNTARKLNKVQARKKAKMEEEFHVRTWKHEKDAKMGYRRRKAEIRVRLAGGLSATPTRLWNRTCPSKENRRATKGKGGR